MTETSLSTRDERVLSLVFNPESQPQQTIEIFDGSLPPVPVISARIFCEKIQSETRRAVKLAEEGHLDEAENVLTDNVEEPHQVCRAALLNDRAQVRRLAGNIDGALADLDRVIQIEIPWRGSLPPTLSKLLSDALFHRATVYLLLSRKEIMSNPRCEDLELLEDRASADFALAARYGNSLARAMSIRTNSYAKLCGAIVQTALLQEIRPDIDYC
jgi:hypothetical protein